MPRTTEEAVKQTIETSLSSPLIVGFILDVNVWVTEELATFTPAISAERLEIIERYLACAMIRCRDLGLKSTTLGDVVENYQVDAELTDYLTRAASFDPSGLVRTHFLAPKPVALPTLPTTPAQFKVGKGFRDSVAEETE